MRDHTVVTYPPLGTLKPVVEDIWIIDGPVIRFGPRWLAMPFSTRTTVIRLADGGLFVHSPTPLSAQLKQELQQTGAVRWLIAPNRLHYWWMPGWQRDFPQARIFLAPRIREQARGRLDFAAELLDRSDGYPWDRDIATLPIVGRHMTEVVFFHRASRTLILTDLIENFECAKLPALPRLLARLGGALDPHGSMPRDMRMTFRKKDLRAAVRVMLAWNPERIILAHGRWYERDGTTELRRRFAWLLKAGWRKG